MEERSAAEEAEKEEEQEGARVSDDRHRSIARPKIDLPNLPDVMPQRHELRLPDLGFADQPMTLSLWLVEVGAEVAEGDRLAELLAGCATVDLPSPASGVLAETLVDEEQTVAPGQLLAVVVECSSEGNDE